jgi:hypothetical protein
VAGVSFSLTAHGALSARGRTAGPGPALTWRGYADEEPLYTAPLPARPLPTPPLPHHRKGRDLRGAVSRAAGNRPIHEPATRRRELPRAMWALSPPLTRALPGAGCPGPYHGQCPTDQRGQASPPPRRYPLPSPQRPDPAAGADGPDSLSPPIRCQFRDKIDDATERVALRAVLATARLLGLAAGTQLRQLRNLSDPLATMQARLDEAQLHARLAWEIIEILSASSSVRTPSRTGSAPLILSPGR